MRFKMARALLYTWGMWINNISGQGVLGLVSGTPGNRDLAQRETGLNRNQSKGTEMSQAISNPLRTPGGLAMDHHNDQRVWMAFAIGVVCISGLLTQGYRLQASPTDVPAVASEAKVLPAPPVAPAAPESIWSQAIQALGQDLDQAVASFEGRCDQATETAKQDLLTTIMPFKYVYRHLQKEIVTSDEVIVRAVVGVQAANESRMQ
jgi:hypothetical protein